jgi:drug/metabolite transporter (DMT)-like permease
MNGLQYAGYALELSLLVLLLVRNRIRRFPALSAYVATLFVVDALGRGWVLRHYGAKSNAYYYSYWLTDLLLALGVFLLVCTFFRRACRDHQEVWAFVRPTLRLILVLVIVVSAVALRANFQNFFTSFIYEFNQDLYFVCLVLNTVLYLMLQRFKQGHEPLNLLVCGLGVQLAGPTAGIALVHLMGNQGASRIIVVYLSSICSVAMMVIWLYAMARGPSTKGTSGSRRLQQGDLLSAAMRLKPMAAAGTPSQDYNWSERSAG